MTEPLANKGFTVMHPPVDYFEDIDQVKRIDKVDCELEPLETLLVWWA